MTVVIDAREMQPPDPFEKTMEALDTLPDGDDLLLLLYCRPHPLFNVLRKNGYGWTENILDEGTHEIRIHKLTG